MSYPQVRAEEHLGAGQNRHVAGEGKLEMNGPSNTEEMSDEDKKHHLKKAVDLKSTLSLNTLKTILCFCWHSPLFVGVQKTLAKIM